VRYQIFYITLQSSRNATFSNIGYKALTMSLATLVQQSFNRQKINRKRETTE